MDKRSSELEIIDCGPSHYTLEEYEDCLVKLDHIGQWLGGDAATVRSIQAMSDPPSSILDIGCGGGLFTIRLAQLYPQAKVVGIDLNPLAIAFAHKRLALMSNPPLNISFQTQELEETSKSFDVVISTLVCHHIPDADLTDFISSACKIAKNKVIFNDLHRHILAVHLFKWISPIFFPNRLVQHDGIASIRRGFVYQDWVGLLNVVGIKPWSYKIRWRWAFRWLIEIDTSGLIHD